MCVISAMGTSAQNRRIQLEFVCSNSLYRLVYLGSMPNSSSRRSMPSRPGKGRAGQTSSPEKGVNGAPKAIDFEIFLVRFG